MLRFIRPLAVAAALAMTLSGCSAESTSTSTTNSEVEAQVDAALKELEGTVLSKGPHGEDPATADTAELTAEEVAEVKSMGATAAIVMHYGGNDWSTAQVDGMQAEFANLGIETFCHKNRLQVEIGAAFPTRGCNACTAIQEALETSKKYV